MRKGAKALLKKYGYMIESYSDETDGQGGQHWFNLKDGYINPMLETNLITETTLSECAKQFKKVIKEELIPIGADVNIKYNGLEIRGKVIEHVNLNRFENWTYKVKVNHTGYELYFNKTEIEAVI